MGKSQREHIIPSPSQYILLIIYSTVAVCVVEQQQQRQSIGLPQKTLIRLSLAGFNPQSVD